MCMVSYFFPGQLNTHISFLCPFMLCINYGNCTYTFTWCLSFFFYQALGLGVTLTIYCLLELCPLTDNIHHTPVHCCSPTLYIWTVFSLCTVNHPRQAGQDKICEFLTSTVAGWSIFCFYVLTVEAEVLKAFNVDQDTIWLCHPLWS